MAAPAAPPVETPQSAAARAYYGQVQQSLLSQGLLRTDGGGDDTPYTDLMLAENFMRVALVDENCPRSVRPVPRQARRGFGRRLAPVRVGLRFGDSVSADKRA